MNRREVGTLDITYQSSGEIAATEVDDRDRIHSKYQRRGIGKELVRRIRESLSDEVALVLVAAATAVEYYPRIGFEKLDSAFIIRRRR